MKARQQVTAKPRPAGFQPRTKAIQTILGPAPFRHDDEIFNRAYSTGLRDLCFLPGTERELGVENGYLFLMPWSCIAVRGARKKTHKIPPLVISDLKDFEYDSANLILAALAYEPEDLEPVLIAVRRSVHAYLAEWMTTLNAQSANAPNRVRPDDYLGFDTPNAADDLRNLPGFFSVNIVETVKRLAAV
ncbi:MAG: hypothetical protein AAFN59_02755 [Pseudomonadota bacterium]